MAFANSWDYAGDQSLKDRKIRYGQAFRSASDVRVRNRKELITKAGMATVDQNIVYDRFKVPNGYGFIKITHDGLVGIANQKYELENAVTDERFIRMFASVMKWSLENDFLRLLLIDYAKQYFAGIIDGRLAAARTLIKCCDSYFGENMSKYPQYEIGRRDNFSINPRVLLELIQIRVGAVDIVAADENDQLFTDNTNIRSAMHMDINNVNPSYVEMVMDMADVRCTNEINHLIKHHHVIGFERSSPGIYNMITTFLNSQAYLRVLSIGCTKIYLDLFTNETKCMNLYMGMLPVGIRNLEGFIPRQIIFERDTADLRRRLAIADSICLINAKNGKIIKSGDAFDQFEKIAISMNCFVDKDAKAYFHTDESKVFQLDKMATTIAVNLDEKHHELMLFLSSSHFVMQVTQVGLRTAKTLRKEMKPKAKIYKESIFKRLLEMQTKIKQLESVEFANVEMEKRLTEKVQLLETELKVELCFKRDAVKQTEIQNEKIIELRKQIEERNNTIENQKTVIEELQKQDRENEMIIGQLHNRVGIKADKALSKTFDMLHCDNCETLQEQTAFIISQFNFLRKRRTFFGTMVNIDLLPYEAHKAVDTILSMANINMQVTPEKLYQRLKMLEVHEQALMGSNEVVSDDSISVDGPGGLD